jgi:hypothetical protein
MQVGCQSENSSQRIDRQPRKNLPRKTKFPISLIRKTLLSIIEISSESSEDSFSSLQDTSSFDVNLFTEVEVNDVIKEAKLIKSQSETKAHINEQNYLPVCIAEALFNTSNFYYPLLPTNSFEAINFGRPSVNLKMHKFPQIERLDGTNFSSRMEQMEALLFDSFGFMD